MLTSSANASKSIKNEVVIHEFDQWANPAEPGFLAANWVCWVGQEYGSGTAE